MQIFNRCVENPNDYFNHDDFTNLVDFNTHETANMLTMAVSELSFKVFHEIELAVKNYDRMVERSKEYGYQTELQQVGDYLLPDIQLSDTNKEPLGKYGTMRRIYLQEHNQLLYNSLAMSEKLFPHLREIDQTAKSRLELLMKQLLEKYPAPDKATHQMEWVGHMNKPESSSGRNNNGRTDLQLNFFDLEQEKAKIID